MPEQWNLGLVALHQTVYPLQATTVDQTVIKGYGMAGSVLIDKEKTIHRAELLGQRIASQLNKPLGMAAYLGPNTDGACPYCHLRVVQLCEKDEIECGTCGARGKIRAGNDGSMRPQWEMDSGISHLTLKGKHKHMQDLKTRNDERGVLAGLQEEYREHKLRIMSRLCKI